MKTTSTHSEIVVSLSKSETQLVDKAIEYDGGSKISFAKDWILYGARELLEEQRQRLKKNRSLSSPPVRQKLDHLGEELKILTQDFVPRESWFSLPLSGRKEPAAPKTP